MSKKIQLSIPKPCHENWDAMTPVEKGKFCGSCQKQVMDFSMMSDRQVAEFFKKPSTGSVCGRFTVDQLERDIEIPKKRIPWLNYFFTIALPAYFMSKAGAQQTQKMMGAPGKLSKDTIPANINQEFSTLGMVLPNSIKPAEEIERGEKAWIVDANTGKALPGAIVNLFSTIEKETFKTRQDGSVVLNIYRKITVKHIEISMPGYITQTLSLADFMIAANTKKPIKLEQEDILVGKIAVLNCVKPVMGDVDTMYTLKGEFQLAPAVSNQVHITVIDEKDEPIPFVNISTGLNVKTYSTNEFGELELKWVLLGSERKITATSVGYETKEVMIQEQQNSVTIKMVRIITELQPVVLNDSVLGRIQRCRVGGVSIVRIDEVNLPAVKPEKEQVLRIYPNPLPNGSAVNVELLKHEEGYFMLNLVNASGQSVQQKEIWIDAEARLLNFDLPTIAAGSYFLVLTNKKTGMKFSEKIIIQ